MHWTFLGDKSYIFDNNTKIDQRNQKADSSFQQHLHQRPKGQRLKWFHFSTGLGEHIYCVWMCVSTLN